MRIPSTMLMTDGGGDPSDTSLPSSGSLTIDTSEIASILANSNYGDIKDSDFGTTSSSIDLSGLIDTSGTSGDVSQSNSGNSFNNFTPDSSEEVIDYRNIANFEAGLSRIAKVGAAMRESGLDTAGEVAKYTQPISIPTIDNGQPLNSDDPRNTKAFANKYGRYPSKIDFQAFQGQTISDIGKPVTTLPEHQNWLWSPITGWTPVWEIGYGPGAFGNNFQDLSGSSLTNRNAQSSVLYAAASDLPVSGNDNTSVSSGNGGAASIENASSFVNNDPIVANITDALPSPVYALDSPENLYIDPNSFTPVILTEYVYIGGSATPSAFSSTVYSVDLKFNAVPGAIKYNYRISATI